MPSSSRNNEPNDTNNTNDVWDNNNDDDETPEQRRRLRDWMYSAGNSPLVQPVQWEDELPPKAERKPMTPKFDSLFDGMPKLNEILGNDDDPPSVAETSVSSYGDDEEDSWFDNEKESIRQEYDKVRKEMIQALEDDDSSPENALAVVDSVLNQEMEREIQERKDQRLREQLEAYEKDLIQRNADLPEKPPEAVMQLMDQSDQDFAKSEKIRQRVEDYQEYERSVQASYNEDDVIDDDASIGDVNKWAMERLQALVDDDSTDNDEASEMIKDILRENLEDLSERMNRPAVKDTSMKEWQMYRAIASRMDETNPDEAEILERMEAWRDYTSREEYLRQQNGLSGISDEAIGDNEQEESPQEKGSKEQRIQTRKTLNRMSIEALESLLSTTDLSRREKLQEEIAFLKATLEQNDYLDVDESFLDDDSTFDPNAPVDTSNLFGGAFVDEDPAEVAPQSLDPSASFPERELVPLQSNLEYETSSQQSSPNPPNTPFFSDAVSADSSTSLGSMEDQKLEAMYRRSGAATGEERETIRKAYEEFKQLEDTKRQASGLSDDTSEVSAPPETLRYNISAVMKEDGDFDADAVLSAIGPRPARTMKTTDPEMADSLYRAVSAVGGGKYKDDTEMDAKQKSSFLEFVEKQAQARQSLDENTLLENVEANIGEPVSVDSEEYAEKLIASLGERPKPKRGRFLSAEELSDRGGLRPGAIDDMDDEDEEDEDEDGEFELGMIPEWLKKENALDSRRRKTMRGEEVDDAFDDSYYEHNARQLAEFERRRRGLGKTMGIDISDVLGRSKVETDDYADFKYDDPYTRNAQVDWGSSAFHARKQNLLEYIELDLEDVNNLMNHKDSVYSTGFSHYLPRINKPFVQYGAIFRLESVLVDTSGLHASVWEQIAEENSYPRPTKSDIQKAALVRAEEAVRDIFFWTNDVRDYRQIALRHRELFRENFSKWMADKNINRNDFLDSPHSVDMVAEASPPIREQAAQPSSRKLSEREFLDKAKTDWSEVARRIAKDPPAEDEIIIAFSVGNEIAVKEIFGWASDTKEINRIVDILDEVSGRSIKTELTIQSNSKDKEPRLTREAAMEAHYRAWLAAAEKFRLRPPSEDEVLVAFVINDVEAAANGFGWEGVAVKDAVEFFNQQIDEALGGKGLSSTPHPMHTTRGDVKEEGINAAPMSLNDFDVQKKVWSVVAGKKNFANPDNDEILFAMSVGPEDAIINGFGWADQPDDVGHLVELYYRALEEETSLAISGRVPPLAQHIPHEESNLDPLFQSIYDSWVTTAQQLGYDAPTMEEVQFAMAVGLEEAIMFGFQWTQDRKEVANIVSVYRDQLSQKRSSWKTEPDHTANSVAKESTMAIQAKPGALKWVKSLIDVEMKCCVVSNLEQDQVEILLHYFGLAELFPHRVSSSNGYSTSKDQLLGAALRLERRPDHCVVFDAVPDSPAAALTMRSVSLVDPHPRYELVSSDSTVGSLDSLTAMDIRRLFTERTNDVAEVEFQQPQKQIQRKTKTSFLYDDD